jgi:hypothetical protein
MRKLSSRTLPAIVAAAGWLVVAPAPALASSHMDAPLITLDDAANTTDVYAFVREERGMKSLVTALGVYPFEEPGIGPNKYNFDDNVLYEIHVATGADVAAGVPTFSYQFNFETKYKNRRTILQSAPASSRRTTRASPRRSTTRAITARTRPSPASPRTRTWIATRNSRSST